MASVGMPMSVKRDHEQSASHRLRNEEAAIPDGCHGKQAEEEPTSKAPTDLRWLVLRHEIRCVQKLPLLQVSEFHSFLLGARQSAHRLKHRIEVVATLLVFFHVFRLQPSKHAGAEEDPNHAK